MPSPTFDGLFLFGVGVECRTKPNPNGRQSQAYPGVNGLQTINLGSRGGVTEITGWLGGASNALLTVSEDAVRAYVANGGAYTFTDSNGKSWPLTILVAYEPQGPIDPPDPILGYSRRYRAELLHLI